MTIDTNITFTDKDLGKNLYRKKNILYTYDRTRSIG